jgi:hypothetical protein
MENKMEDIKTFEFKVLTLTKSRNKKVQQAFFNAGGIWGDNPYANPIEEDVAYVYASAGKMYYCKYIDTFSGCNLPEIVPEQLVTMLKTIKSKSNIFEVEVDKDGCIIIDKYKTMWFSCKNVLAEMFISKNVKYAFAGYVYYDEFLEEDEITTEILGYDESNVLTSECKNWAEPAIPKKIRFFKI